MTFANQADPERAGTYSAGAKTFHWITAALVLITWPIGFTIASVEFESAPLRDRLYNLHWSFGATVLTIAALRWLHRLFRRPVAAAPGVPAWRYRVATTVHWALYVLLLAVPLLGWAGRSAYGGQIMIFGLFELPPLLAQDQPLGERILAFHRAAAVTLGGLVVLHVAAALEHHFIRRDTTLVRMLPGGGAPQR